MTARKVPLPKESVLQKKRLKRKRKAIPPPDNPLLRHQAEEVDLQGERANEEQMARLRLNALEQTKKMPTTDVADTSENTPGSDDQR